MNSRNRKIPEIIYFHNNSIISNKANVIQVLEMCQSLSHIGIKTDLFFPDKKTDSDTLIKIAKDKLGSDSLSFHLKNYRPISLFGRFKFLYPFYKILFNKDSVFYLRDPFLFSIVGILNRKILFEAHDTLENNSINYTLQRLFIHNVKKPNLIKFICISQNLADWYLENGIPKDKIIVLHDGANVDLFTPSENSAYYKKKLGIDYNKPTFCYSGSLDEERNIKIILESAAHFPQCYFIIIGGDSKQVDQLRNFAEELNIRNVIIYTYMNRIQLREYLWASDFLLMLWSKNVSTINYCSPLKTFEYMSCKRAIIGHDFPTIREVLQNEIDAILIEPDSKNALIKAIERVLKGDFSKISDNAYQKVIKKYTWEKRAKTIKELIMNYSSQL